MSKFAFTKYLFNLALNGISIAKYQSGEHVKLVAERNGRKVRNSHVFVFNCQRDYELWLDDYVSDNDAFFNHPRALNNALSAMGV